MVYVCFRTFACIMDNSLIIAFFCLLLLGVFAINIKYAGYVGEYLGWFHLDFNKVINGDLFAFSQKYNVDPNVDFEEWIEVKNEYYEQFHKDFVRHYLITDLSITLSFVLLNTLYYLISELYLRSSFFKYLFGFVLEDNQGNQIGNRRIILRAIILTVLMLLAVSIRFLGPNYYWCIALFFIVVESPVLFCKKSLVDILSNTIVIRKRYINKKKRFNSPSNF